ncbi:Uncharacterised protein [Porphyromonas macacae]|uniref:Uncharacterized protein n=1 Tax=Porphyromonas macacae TaxID=28115 RepID=A0A379EC74_9PORP|nr:Uncharacterised protein [Porphyromonas macacae]
MGVYIHQSLYKIRFQDFIGIFHRFDVGKRLLRTSILSGKTIYHKSGPEKELSIQAERAF